MATTLNLESLYHLVHEALGEVRSTTQAQWTEAFQLVYGSSAQPPRVGGKLLRPALCLLSAAALGAKDLNRFVPMASSMELLHVAALAHDDVVDGAHLRRGETSLNALWDNHIAVLGGDYLVAKALGLLTIYDSCAVISSALESIHQMAEGELINFGRGKAQLNEEDCVRLAEKKTASLFAVTCSTPTLLLGGEHREALHAFGMGLGTAFQLIDDILDLDQNESMLGKPSCGDIVEGKTTLPIIYMRNSMNDAEAGRFASMMGGTLSGDDRKWIAEMLEHTGAKERVETLASDYIARARLALDALPPSEYREAMLNLASFVIVRQA